MKLQIITPEKVLYDDEIDELIVPTVNGEIAILPHHADLLTQLAPGEMTIKHSGKLQHMAVTGGFLEIGNETISLLAEFAVRSEEINAKAALEAQERAERKLKEAGETMSEREIADVRSEMLRAITSLKVAQKRHHQSQNF
jgi:F-type H+-transporting ATPase subunit epsilon